MLAGSDFLLDFFYYSANVIFMLQELKIKGEVLITQDMDTERKAKRVQEILLSCVRGFKVTKLAEVVKRDLKLAKSTIKSELSLCGVLLEFDYTYVGDMSLHSVLNTIDFRHPCLTIGDYSINMEYGKCLRYNDGIKYEVLTFCISRRDPSEYWRSGLTLGRVRKFVADLKELGDDTNIDFYIGAPAKDGNSIQYHGIKSKGDNIFVIELGFDADSPPNPIK